MGIARKARDRTGQMTIELSVAMPVMIIVAVIAANALTFFSECAVFDRIAHDSVRIHASSPGYGQGIDASCASVKDSIESQMHADNIDISVTHGITGIDLDEYTMTLEYSPTLFGMGLRSEVFGVQLPHLMHSTRYVVDSYKAGVVI